LTIIGTGPLAAAIAVLMTALGGLTGPSITPAPATSRRLPVPHVAATASHAPFAVGIRTITFVDSSRTVRYPGRPPEPRKLVTVIRYPAAGPATAVDVPGAPPALSAGPFPLIIFGHGFAVTPGPYAQLLEAWARAGFVVAAPIFPLENAKAPGGPNESDLVNQPRDMSFVITRMLALGAARRGLFSGLLARDEIAVSGQSDGGETALAAAYDSHFRDRRIRAAAILSGAEIPGVGGWTFASPSPPLLATQGTADTVNRPHFTYQFFNLAPRPKFLLSLLGAPHLPPYTDEQPQLGIVERVTIAFFDKYLGGGRGALARMIGAGNVPGVAQLTADP
jgi:dienelactone hydrolase